MVSLEERTQGIKHFRVSSRIQDGLTTFEVDYLTPAKPDDLECGGHIDIELYDVANPGQTTVVGGRIQKVTHDMTENGNIYSISGRDYGYFLVKNDFSLDCALTSNTTFTAAEMLDTILADESIEVGTGTNDLSQVTLHTNGNLTAGYCGIWKNKKEAIDQLFREYAKQAGTNRIRWYVDNNGKLRWFETNKHRGNISTFQLETQEELIKSFNITEDAENIVNQLTGYGCDDVLIKSTQKVQASINKYGLQIGEDITDSSIKSQTEMAAKVYAELQQKAWPIYTATLVLKKFYDIEVGQQMKFPDHPNYSTVLFTCVQKDIEGNPADITTTLQFSTDESAIAPANNADVTKAIVNDALKDNKSNFGTVIDVSDEDCTNLLVRPYGKDTLVNAKSSNSCVNYNSSGLSEEEEDDGFEFLAG